MAELLWQKTPLIRSSALSAKTGCEVYLKIESFQTSGSFKGRGVSHYTNQAVKGYFQNNGPKPVDTYLLATKAAEEDMEQWSKPTALPTDSEASLPYLVTASGGNAGLAAASAARIIGLPCTIFVPAAQENIRHAFERHNTRGNIEVRVGGENYYQAYLRAQEMVKELGPKAIFAPPYDDPLVWQGNSTLLHEISEQLPTGVKPDAIFCSVGGGGLIAGIMLGCRGLPGWDEIPVIGIEPVGSACFYHSMQANRSDDTSQLPSGATVDTMEVPNPWNIASSDAESGSSEGSSSGSAAVEPNESKKSAKVAVVHLPKINSKASSLGASSPSASAVAMALQRKGVVKTVAISDERCMSAALQFTGDHFVIAELACSATLVPAYTPKLLDQLVPPPHLSAAPLIGNGTNSAAYTYTSAKAGEGSGTSNGEPLQGEENHDGQNAESTRKTANAERKRVLVFVVCGGSKASLEELREYEAVLAGSKWNEREDDEIWLDGSRISL